MSGYDMELAREVVALAEPVLSALGYHCGITGSVLYHGKSDKDLNVVVYPHDPKKTISSEIVLDALASVGFVNRYKTDADYVNREVWIVAYKSLRVDVFFFDQP